MKKIIGLILTISILLTVSSCTEPPMDAPVQQEPSNIVLTKDNLTEYVDFDIFLGRTDIEMPNPFVAAFYYNSSLTINVTPKKSGNYENFSIKININNIPVEWIIDGISSTHNYQINIPYTGSYSKTFELRAVQLPQHDIEYLPFKLEYEIVSVEGVFRPV